MYYDLDASYVSYESYGGAGVGVIGTPRAGGAGTINKATWFQSTNAYETSGTFTSPAIDTTADRSDFIDLSWNANIPSGTSLKFQLAYSSDGSSWSSFLGPDGTVNTYFTSSGQAIPSAFDGKRYIKYKIFLQTSDSTKTPKLNDITIKYKALPYITTVGSTGAIGGRYALENGKRYSLDGLIDEVGIWSRDLTASEMLNLYKRGILKLTLSVRSCDDAACDTESFTGSFNDATIYTLLLEQNRYFQYKAEFETENTAYTPSLTKVEVDFKVS